MAIMIYRLQIYIYALEMSYIVIEIMPVNISLITGMRT